ncbi:hypothetical protein NC661_03140 [Aquibacillus koreensis]|uniref:Uncharacterized protein n=1 Tax=Aquibacillus koreensis TaxID=279446 RepID=A0A9X3WIW2_9BACI|nr:hypothetical protein [Aquibacillus koreensis]MCT2536557.1 hypothetical protein [Aquibacillus koreensis]MDC3419355.1 hypothetical protein [Aquibacillus koreensis]
MKKQTKAFGYFLVEKEFAESNHEYYQQIFKGFEEICKHKNLKLVKVYEDRFSDESKPQPTKELCKLIRKKNKGDYLINFALGRYMIMSPDGQLEII